MKMHFAAASLAAMALCGTMRAQTKSDQAPSGTVVEKQHGANNEVQPAPEKIRITPASLAATRCVLSVTSSLCARQIEVASTTRHRKSFLRHTHNKEIGVRLTSKAVLLLDARIRGSRARCGRGWGGALTTQPARTSAGRGWTTSRTPPPRTATSSARS